jgi:hypothetical protein
MALAWWLVPCLTFPGLPHIYFLFTVWLRIFHVCRNENFRNSYLSFYWKKWFYIWYMALAWWLVPCLSFPGLPHIYFLFTVRLTNERVGVFLSRRSVQHLVFLIAVNRERGDTVQVTMPKPYIKYQIISSSRSWDICYENVNGRTNGQINGRTDGRTRWLQYCNNKWPLVCCSVFIY